jgi:hypothetical protein
MRAPMLVCLLVALCGTCHADGYPRIANLWGCGPTAANYEQWARYDLLVMGGGAPEAWRTFRRETKPLNPDLLLLGTAPLMNIGSPESTPWMRDEWYVRRPDGEKVNWWAGQVYVPNILIDGCLDALLEQTEKAYGDVLRDGTLNGVFYDSVVGRVSWLGEVDTDLDGRPDVAAEVDPKWHERQNLFFDRLRERYPGILILANDVDAGHAPHVNGRLFEGAPLLDRSLDGTLSPREAANELDTWMTSSAQPGITFAIMTHPLGWQGWRVGKGNKVTTPGELDRVRRDFARMRTGLCTALMTDAYYAYDFGTVWYGLPFWYAEYDAPLGKPLGPAKEVSEVPPIPVLDWQAGQPTEVFVLDGPANATPEGIVGDVADSGGWQRLFATDFRRVRLEPGKRYHITATCEVLRKPTNTFQFDVRTGRGGWEHHDKGIVHNAGEAGAEWTVDVTITPDDFDDYALEWHVLGAGGLRLERLHIDLVGESYLLREFEGGVAILNDTPFPVQVKLDRPYRRLKDDAAPRYVTEVDDGGPGFTCEGAWEVAGGEAAYAGAGYRLAAKPGATARWSLVVPSTDTYTLFATAPGGKTLTDSAAYSCGDKQATVDQRPCDGGWVKLFEVGLAEGERCEVVLTSSGEGATAADAIRAESAARYNDGSTVEELTLGPVDGTVLVRE